MEKAGKKATGKRIVAKIMAEIAQEKRNHRKAEEKYDPHDDWHWNDH